MTSNVVIDASALIAVIINEDEKERMIELTQGSTLIAPRSIHWEIGNALAAMFKRKRITLEQAKQAISVYEQIVIRFVEIELDEAVVLAHQLNIYAYDAYLVRCAIKYSAPLLTLDRRLRVVAANVGATLIEV